MAIGTHNCDFGLFLDAHGDVSHRIYLHMNRKFESWAVVNKLGVTIQADSILTSQQMG